MQRSMTKISIQEVIDKKLGGGGSDSFHYVYGEQDADAWYSDLNEENSIVNTVTGKFSGTKVTV